MALGIFSLSAAPSPKLSPRCALGSEGSAELPVGGDGVRGPQPRCWAGDGGLCPAAPGRREGDSSRCWAGCRGLIPSPIPLTQEGRGLFLPGEFRSLPCPVGLPWASITLMGDPEQWSGLMEFPLGKTHRGERVVPSAVGGNPCPLHGEPLNSLQGGFRLPHTAELPLGTLFPCPGVGSCPLGSGCPPLVCRVLGLVRHRRPSNN